MKKALILDFDGTIAETFPIVFKAIETAYTKLGLIAPSREELYANFGPHEQALLNKISTQGDALFAEYIKATEKFIKADNLQPFDNIKNLLNKAKELGMKICMITGKSKESMEVTLKHLGLEKYFDILKWGGETGSVKPQRFKEIFTELNLTADDVYYVGDSTMDIDDCREVGVQILSAGWADCADIEALKTKKPDALFYSVQELIDFLKQDK